jgi:hypothetical protein
MKNTKIAAGMLCVCLFVGLHFSGQAQVSNEMRGAYALGEELKVKDSLLFHAVFTTHDLQAIESIFAQGFSFYQVNGGPETPPPMLRPEFIGNIKRRWEGSNSGPSVRRVASSLQVFPQDMDGALQTGIQRFYLVIPGGSDQLVETSRFSRIWHRSNGRWEIVMEIDNPDESPAAKSAAMKAQPVYTVIAHLDSVLFNAFNAQDVVTFQSLFDNSLEFYHDKAGFTGYAWNMENFKKHMTDPSLFTRRELVEGSLEIYPINNYGAVEIGIHRFYSKQNGPEKLEATAKFVTLWQQRDGVWKITREISYDHQ